MLDTKTSIPVFVQVTAGSVPDVNGLDELTYETGGYYILDRYIDFERLLVIDKHDAFFVIRARGKNDLIRICSSKYNKSKGVMCDQQVIPKGYLSYKSYPKIFRRIKFYDAEQNGTFIFFSYNLTLPAIEIAKK